MKILDARQEAKLNMYQVVQSLCDANTPIVETNKAFANALIEFKAKIAQIDVGTGLTSLVLTGIAADKSVSKQDLSVIATQIAGLIFAFAAKTGNNTLKQAVNFSTTDISKLKDGEIAPQCQNIHDSGVANLANLADYGVTTAKLDDLQTAINSYTGHVAKPRTAITERATTKANIKQYFKQADAILTEQMDKLVENFKADNPDFVSTYRNARIIIDPAKTTTKITGTATGTNGQATGFTQSTTTNEAGKYTLIPVPPGDYTITVKAAGFVDFTQTAVKATMGTNNHLNVRMEAS